jgi:hypothetical protein
MAATAQSAIAVIGIDIGKNSFHVVGPDFSRRVPSCRVPVAVSQAAVSQAAVSHVGFSLGARIRPATGSRHTEGSGRARRGVGENRSGLPELVPRARMRSQVMASCRRAG